MTAPQRTPRRERFADSAGRTLEVMAAAVAPCAAGGVPWVPLGIAAAATAVAAILALVAAVDLARALLGADAIGVALLIVVLVLPGVKLGLGVPSGPMALLARTAALLRALDLGAGLARGWHLAALLSPIGPIAVGGLAAACLLASRGATSMGVALAAAAIVGALVAWPFCSIGARRLDRAAAAPPAWRRVLAQLVLALGCGAIIVALAPLATAEARAPLALATAVGALAVAVHLSGEVLAVDLRASLRLVRALLDTGAARGSIAVPVLAAACAVVGAAGATAAMAVTSLAGDAAAGCSTGFAVASAMLGAIAVAGIEPSAAAIVRRVALYAVALVPPGLAVASGSLLAAGVVAAAALAATAAVVLGRAS